MTNTPQANVDSKRKPKNKEMQDLLLPGNQLEKKEAEDLSFEEDLAAGHTYKTKHSDGHTFNPHVAAEQGLVYTPPSDPPVLPSPDDPQGAEVAAGFAPAMEETSADVEILPPHVDNQDLDLRDDVYIMLRNNSETGHLTNVNVQVQDGIVKLIGTVESEDDFERVERIIAELPAVKGVQLHLQVEGIS